MFLPSSAGMSNAVTQLEENARTVSEVKRRHKVPKGFELASKKCSKAGVVSYQ